MELNFLSKETRSLSLSFADRLKAFAGVTDVNLALASALVQSSLAVSLGDFISASILFFFFLTVPVQFFFFSLS